MQYFYSTDIHEDIVTFEEQESAHITRVLRKSIGDELWVLDGLGSLYKTILKTTGKCATAEVLGRVQHQKEPFFKLTIAISATKKLDRMEWMVEKLVEIGVHRIMFIQTEKGERARINLERLNKKSLSAMKQSGHLWLPEITSEIKFATFVKSNMDEQRFIAHCFDTDKGQINRENLIKIKSATMMIGPEGDFSTTELELAVAHGFTPVSLGIPRYRTETAAVVACTLINHFCVTLKANN